MKKILHFLLLPALCLVLAGPLVAQEAADAACRADASAAAPAFALPDDPAAAALPLADNPVCGSCSGSCSGLKKNAACYSQSVGNWGVCAAPTPQTCSDGKLLCACLARPIG